LTGRRLQHGAPIAANPVARVEFDRGAWGQRCPFQILAVFEQGQQHLQLLRVRFQRPGFGLGDEVADLVRTRAQGIDTQSAQFEHQFPERFGQAAESDQGAYRDSILGVELLQLSRSRRLFDTALDLHDLEGLAGRDAALSQEQKQSGGQPTPVVVSSIAHRLVL
jgi:hypothetical protein